MRFVLLTAVLSLALGCKTAGTPEAGRAASRAPTSSGGYRSTTIALPGGGPDGVGMDAIAYDTRTQTVWVPAGNTANVDVIDTATGKLTSISGFPTRSVERHGHQFVVGPSSAAVGDGVVYVGNRGDSSICAIDDQTLSRKKCATLDSMPDLVAYVAKTHEVWVTTPRDRSIRILDAETLSPKAKLTFDGSPEGTAVDEARGRFYTNLEDKDRTLAIDLDSHQTVATWQPQCGEEGPHGLVLDEAHGFLFVACSAKAETLDVGRDGAVVGSVDTGDGVDLLDYAPTNRKLYVAAGHDAKLTVAEVASNGALKATAVVPTAPRARNAVVSADGKVYLTHSPGSELIVLAPSAP